MRGLHGRDQAWTSFVTLACDHHYCRKCIARLFVDSCKDETLFPPRCCRQVIDPELVRTLLTPEAFAHFTTKSVELKTKDRLYCVDPSCGVFIGPALSIGDDITSLSMATQDLKRRCPRCGTQACAACKGAAHPRDQICRRDQDEVSQAVLAMGRQEGWQRCPTCSHLLELKEGCHHMTCICKAEFCFLCKAQWPSRREGSTCRNGCPLFSEGDEAARRVHEQHACIHPSIFYSTPGGECDQCSHYLRDFLFACRECGVRMCARCKRNRLL